MPFSFNPGQDQSGQAPAPSQAPAPVTNNGVPALNVPVAPTISLTPVAEVISPFAYKNRSKSKFGVYLQSALFLVFGLNLIAALGLVGYKTALAVQISSKKDALMALQADFKRPPIEDMQKLSARIALINKVVNERASARAALTVLEESVNDAVTYTKFSMSKSKKNTYYDLSFSGETNSYTSLYQQLEILRSKTFAGAFPKIEISGVGPLDKKGITTFNVSASLAIAGVDPDGFTITHKGGDDRSTSTPVVVATSTLLSAPVEASSSLNVIQQ